MHGFQSSIKVPSYSHSCLAAAWETSGNPGRLGKGAVLLDGCLSAE